MRVSFNRALFEQPLPLFLSLSQIGSLSLLHFPPFPSSAHRHVVTRAVLLHGRFVRVKNDWFCLIRGQERGTWHRASANCEMQEFKEARPEVRSASTGSPMKLPPNCVQKILFCSMSSRRCDLTNLFFFLKI